MLIAVIRTIILYLLIILGIRLLGKRQIGELEPSELVLSLIIADLAAVPMQDFGIPLCPSLIIISDGHILTHNLTARNLSQGWLEDQLHSRGIQSVEQIYLMTVDEMEGVYLIQKEAKV